MAIDAGDRIANAAGADGASAFADVEGLVRAMIGMMRSGNVTELDVAFGDVSVRLRSPGGSQVAGGRGALPPTEALAAIEPVAGHLITAPMIGTFYASPSPGEPDFVAVGDPVEAGQTIGIIEAMKIMNEIAADRSGIVDAILAGNAQPVEYGSPLLRLRPEG